MKKITISILLVLTTALTMSTVLTSCSFSNPEDTIDLFIENLNAFDMDGMFSCFEPRAAQQMQAAYNVGSGISSYLTGMSIDIKSLALLMPLFSGMDLGDGSKLYWPQWETTDYQTSIDGDTAEIITTIIVTTGDEVERYDAKFIMVNIEGEWYIENME